MKRTLVAATAICGLALATTACGGDTKASSDSGPGAGGSGNSRTVLSTGSGISACTTGTSSDRRVELSRGTSTGTRSTAGSARDGDSKPAITISLATSGVASRSTGGGELTGEGATADSGSAAGAVPAGTAGGSARSAAGLSGTGSESTGWNGAGKLSRL